MSAVLQQLKVAYEQEGMSIDEIASDLDLEPIAVKSGLMQVSSKYRKEVGAPSNGEENSNDFTDDQLRDINDVIYQIAVSSESDKVRLAAATYIRDDKKGRKELKRLMGSGGVTINVLEAFNNRLSQVRKVIEA